MNQKELLFTFENKYHFLYDIESNGVPIYTCLRDGVSARLQGKSTEETIDSRQKGKVYIRRILDSWRKLNRFRNKKTLIFTSSVYRRDKGRNLAAEYLVERYPDAVVFEWPSRNEAYDKEYFSDQMREYYCPLEFYIILYKFYVIICQKQYEKLYQECRENLVTSFGKCKNEVVEYEQRAIDYLMKELPASYAATKMSQRIFAKLFKRYYGVEYAIDFWGSARENIIPVLPGKPRSVELQHGIITSIHPGYIYPTFVGKSQRPFFQRKLLVYGEKTKELLTNSSIFAQEQIEVIGNPRIKMYRQRFSLEDAEKKTILFTSQPIEQDGTGMGYYETVIQYLKVVQKTINQDERFFQYKLAIKLHPRENERVVKKYSDELSDAIIYGNTSQLFELLDASFVQITVSSTSLYEAAEFGTPTININYNNFDSTDIYGFATWTAESSQDVINLLERLLNAEEYEEYLQYLQENTKHYM